MLQLSPVALHPLTLPVAPARPATADSPALPADRVTLRPVAFQPETASGPFQSREVPGGGPVEYYDAKADAQDRELYYGKLPLQFPGMSARELYSTLSTLVQKTHTTQLDYDPEHTLYPWVDRRPSLKLDSIYSDKAETGPEATSDPGGLWILADGEGPSSLVYSEKESKIYNCEHVVPQSWFDKKGPMRGDLHHLFTCDIDCNSLRGNSLYFEFLGKIGEKFPSCGITDAGRDHFEPYGGKGAVARAVLYFLERYPGYVGDEPGEYTAKDVEMLKKWSRENPVTEYEQHRNRAIQQKQGNRNPFIDFPDLVDRVDFTQGLGRM